MVTRISVAFLSDIERGKSNPSQKTLETLSEFYGVEIRPTTSQDVDARCLENLEFTLAEMRKTKPNERSEKARRYQIVITDLEKVLSFFKVYVVEETL